MYTNTSISNSTKNSDAHFLNIYTEKTVFNIIENIDVKNLRQVNYLKLGPRSKMEFGFDVELNETYYDYYRKLTKSELFINEIAFDRVVKTTNYAAFLTVKQNLFSRMILSTGFRLDHITITKI